MVISDANSNLSFYKTNFKLRSGYVMKKRWYNIFKEDNKSFVLAMDHGSLMDVTGKLKNPGEVIKKAKKGGIDAILTTYGIAKKYHDDMGNLGLILRIDGGTTCIHPDGYVADRIRSTFSAEDAVKLGADGVMSMGFTGLDDEDKMIQMLSKNASEADKLGLVYGIEMIPGGFKKESQRTLEKVAFTARFGAEYGADFVKTCYVEGSSAEEYKLVVENCFRPVLVLGGGDLKADKELFTMIKNSMDAGAKGVVIGRNVWKRSNVENYCRAIAKIVHENISVDEALKEL